MRQLRHEFLSFFMNHIQISVKTVSADQSELLIAKLLEAGFEGFEEEGMLLHAFCPAHQFDESILREIADQFGITYSRTDVADRNWNEEWEKKIEPVIIDDFAAIRAAFHPPMKNIRHELIITPKMSFGTGHHATTTMMIRAMQKIDFTGREVMDFGTGTGILAILASKMGAKEVLAIDYDDWSINNALENVAVNDSGNITVTQSNSTLNTGIFDIILANINRHVIMENLAGFRQHLRPQGVLILSGFLTQDEAEIESDAKEYGLIKERILQEGDWICMTLKMPA